MKQGIFIAKPGKSVGPNNNQFDTNNPHLLINLLKNPKHMDIVQFRGGTNFVASNGAVSDQIETLFSIRHGLAYTPEVFFYLLALTYQGSATHAKAGSYADKNMIISGSLGTITDSIYAKVDGESFSIVHELDNFWPINFTSDAADYNLQLKYYILSRDSKVSSYNTRGY